MQYYFLIALLNPTWMISHLESRSVSLQSGFSSMRDTNGPWIEFHNSPVRKFCLTKELKQYVMKLQHEQSWLKYLPRQQHRVQEFYLLFQLNCSFFLLLIVWLLGGSKFLLIPTQHIPCDSMKQKNITSSGINKMSICAKGKLTEVWGKNLQALIVYG